jgi:hypothetical protein
MQYNNHNEAIPRERKFAFLAIVKLAVAKPKRNIPHHALKHQRAICTIFASITIILILSFFTL